MNEEKQQRKTNKYIENRKATPEEILYIFEHVLEGWRTIKIYNIMIQNDKFTKITKKNVECIATGNVRIYPFELSEENYEKYSSLREQVYEFNKNIKMQK
jgi:hypothetical protein